MSAVIVEQWGVKWVNFFPSIGVIRIVKFFGLGPDVVITDGFPMLNNFCSASKVCFLIKNCEVVVEIVSTHSIEFAIANDIE